MVSSLYSISLLTPDTFRINLQFKVIELVISMETKHEASNSLITIYEYLIADDTGCIILNTQSELEIDATFEMKDGHTRVIDNYLRLYSSNLTPSPTTISTVNTQHNLSFVQLERKI